MLQQLDKYALDTVLGQWLTAESVQTGDAVAIDGKNARGSGHGARKRPVHLLSALVHRTGQMLGQVDVDITTNEIPKLKDLLDPLDIAGAVVTTDALHTQRAAALPVHVSIIRLAKSLAAEINSNHLPKRHRK